MEYVLTIVRIFPLFACALHSKPTRSYESSMVRVLLNDLLYIYMYYSRLDRGGGGGGGGGGARPPPPPPQVTKLVHLIIRESSAILHGGRKYKSDMKTKRWKPETAIRAVIKSCGSYSNREIKFHIIVHWQTSDSSW